MIRRISTKWVLAVLAVVVVPFVVFALFVDTKVTERLSNDVVRFHLLSMAADLADRLDAQIDERRTDVAVLAGWQEVSSFVKDLGADRETFRSEVQYIFDIQVEVAGVYDFIMALDANGRGVGMNSLDAQGRELPEAVRARLLEREWGRADNEWFARVLRDGSAVIDFHRIGLDDSDVGRGRVPRPSDYYVGFAARIDALPGLGSDPVGVVLALMNWRHIQNAVSSFGIRQLYGEAGHAVGYDIYKSAYSWLWKDDADTIIAHPRRALYGQKVTELQGGGLAPLVEAARSSSWGMYPDYVFRGIDKKAAFKHCEGPESGGLGWVVGVGVDNADIYAPVEELSSLLITSSAIVLSFAVAFTFFIAHRTTRPILTLQQYTRRVASGDLDSRVEVKRKDELGDLANAFNRMTAELKENRAQLVKAEKDAAWREMARQVAHEIKNPLTPISVTAGLLKRAHDEHSPDFDEILERTIEVIQRQVENMREIASDFYAFAGEHKEPRVVQLGALLDEVLELNSAWAKDQRVRVHRRGSDGRVHADPDELRRALQNLVTNAIEAMPAGGDIYASVADADGEIALEIRDTGSGLSEEVADKLFEPYFTTRSSGTGLGLAVVRRVVEDAGGRVQLENAPEGGGAIARIVLPRHS